MNFTSYHVWIAKVFRYNEDSVGTAAGLFSLQAKVKVLADHHSLESLCFSYKMDLDNEIERKIEYLDFVLDGIGIKKEVSN